MGGRVAFMVVYLVSGPIGHPGRVLFVGRPGKEEFKGGPARCIFNEP
jgi:hypothetical protein